MGAALRSLVRRRTEETLAVNDISFDLAPGEIVGFLGPNGAGKTTTLKMLSGLLHPTAGEVDVLGHVPWKREREFLRRITLVMGQRNQLIWDIPAEDSFELNRAIYRIPAEEYWATLRELSVPPRPASRRIRLRTDRSLRRGMLGSHRRGAYEPGKGKTDVPVTHSAGTTGAALPDRV
jgi:ABC-type ATPase with predicted acetyltransferase domain